jgi:hypothetical protein
MTITLTSEEAQQVLDALEDAADHIGCPDDDDAIGVARRTLRARLAQPEPEYRDVVIKGDLWRIEFLPDHAASVVLVKANYEAQPEPEPVAWGDCVAGLAEARLCKSWCGNFNCSATEPQREWQGLTDEEICKWTPEVHDLIRAIEAKLKEKNT